MRVLIDQGVLAQNVISLGSGIRGSAVILTTADLRRALPDAEIGDFQGE
jgi:prolyl-tRNA editing enzyme YbaK/EbsC (Cys-tRNA(Pro) deacylase)